MIYGVGLASFVRKMRSTLNRNQRRAKEGRSGSNRRIETQMELLEDRSVPASFWWTGQGALWQQTIFGDSPLIDDMNAQNPALPPAPVNFRQLGIDYFTHNATTRPLAGTMNFSDPRNWRDSAGNMVAPPNGGSGHDLIFDHQFAGDFDLAPGTSPFDGVDDDTDFQGSFAGINDNFITSCRSITFIDNSGIQTAPGSVWWFTIKGSSIKIETQSGVRTFGDGRVNGANINLDLINGNGVSGFNITTNTSGVLTHPLTFQGADNSHGLFVAVFGPGETAPNNSNLNNDRVDAFDPQPAAPPPGRGNINLFDSVQNVGGVINCITEAPLTINGAITGAGAGDGSRVFKTGTGTLTITNRGNTYNGLTTIDQGTVVLTPNATLGNTQGDVLIKTNTPTTTLLLTQSFIDPITLQEQFARIPVGEDIYMEASTQLLGQNNTFIDGKVFLLGSATIGASDDAANGVRAQFRINGQITDGNFLVNDITFNTGIDIDSYILLSNTTNNYRGSTIVTGERLLKLYPDNNVGDDPANGFSGVIPNASPVILVDKASLDLNNFVETIGSLENTVSNGARVVLGVGRLTTGTNDASTTFSGRISSAVVTSGDQGGINKIGAGVFVLSGSNTYTGRTIIREGTLQLGAAGVIDDNNRVLIENQAIFDLNSFDETIGSLEGGVTGSPIPGGPSTSVLLGSATLTVGGNNLSTVFDGVISGSGGITKRGTGTLQIGGQNSFSGPTAIIGGAIKQKDLANRLNSTTAVTVDPGATLDLANLDLSIGSLAGGYNAGSSGSVLLGSAGLTVGTNDSSTVYRGIIVGTGGLTKIGAGNLSLLNPGNTYSGATNVNAGILTVGDFTNPFGINGAVVSNITVKSGAKLAGDGTITGAVVVQGGATFSPNSPLVVHSMIINGSLALQAGSTYVQKINDQTLYSRLTVNGTVDLGVATTTLSFIVSGAYVPVNLAEFVMIKNDLADAIVGYFQGGTPTHPLPTTSYVLVGTNLFRITYDIEGGSGIPGAAGNDVVLRSTLNHAPVLDTTPTPTLPKLYEDLAGPGQQPATVASLLGAAVTDSDTFAVQGIAIVATGGTTAGTWQYSIDNSTWVDFPAVSNTNALLLRSVDRVRFVPAADANGTATIDYHAWDQTNGVIGGTVDLSTVGTGGSTAFSIAIDTATVTIVPINDAPVNQLAAGPYGTNEDVPLVLSGISVTDVDSASGFISVTFAVNNGTLRVNAAVAGGVSAGNIFFNNTASLTLVGTVAQINTTLANATGLTYTNTQDYNGNDTLTMTTSDLGNSGNDPNSIDNPSPSLVDVDTRTIVIAAINDAPVLNNALPALLTSVLEDDTNPPGDFISAFASPIITDVDIGALKGIAIIGTQQVTAGDTGPLTGTWQYFNGASWTAFGTVSASSALLLPEGYKVRFVPDANKNGVVSFSFRAWDQTSGTAGNRVNITATGGATAFSAAANSARLTVTSQVDAPIITLPGGPINYLENSGLQILDALATVSDNDSTAFNNGTLTVSFAVNGTTDDRFIIKSDGNLPGQIFVQGSTIRYSGGVIGSFTGGTNGTPLVITFTAGSSIPSVQALIRNIGFRNDSDFPSPLARTVSFVMFDGAGGTSTPALKIINILEVNDAPVLTVPAAFFNTNENQAVAITGIVVDDVDVGTGNMMLTFTVPNGKVTILTTVAGGITAGQITGNGTSLVTLTGTRAALNATLAATNGVVYKGNLNFNGEEDITVDLNDLGNTGSPGALTDSKTVVVVLSPVNSAPVNTLPTGPLNAFEDIGLLITGVSISDADVGNGPTIVSFTVNRGLLFFTTNAAGGVPANQINGNGTSSVTFAFGTLAQVNATLAAGFTYVGKSEVDYTDILTMFTNDLGNTGTGGQLTDTDTLNIIAKAVNDLPVNVMPATLDAFTNTDTAINSIYSNDPDAFDGTINVSLSALHGTLRVNANAATGVTVNNNGTGTVTFIGTQSKINTILATLVYRATLNYVGADTLTMSTNDNGNSGIGGPLSSTANTAVTVKSRSLGAPGQGTPKPDVIGRLNGKWWLADSDGNQFINKAYGAWSTAVQWNDVSVGDINGDGADDVFGRDSVTGVWQAGITTLSGFVNVNWGQWSPVSWSDVRVADVNGDGLIDVIGRETSTGNWWGGISNGSAFANRYLGTWSPAITWADVSVLDLNGDGKTDIVGRDKASGVWYAGTSNGAGFKNSTYGAWAPSVNWVDVKASDVNGDGLGDVIGRDKQSGLWWAGISNSTGFINQYLGQWTPAINWIDVQATDLNGDDKTDVVGRDSATGQWWAGISNGSQFTMSLFGAWSAGAPWVDVQTIDVNSDGKLDVVGRLSDTGDWWVAKSNGTSFTNQYFGRWSVGNWVDVKVGNFNVPSASSGQTRPSRGGAATGGDNSSGGSGQQSFAGGGTATKSARVERIADLAGSNTAAATQASKSFRSNGAISSAGVDMLFSRAHAPVRSAVDLFANFDDVI